MKKRGRKGGSEHSRIVQQGLCLLQVGHKWDIFHRDDGKVFAQLNASWYKHVSSGGPLNGSCSNFRLMVGFSLFVCVCVGGGGWICTFVCTIQCLFMYPLHFLLPPSLSLLPLPYSPHLIPLSQGHVNIVDPHQ